MQEEEVRKGHSVLKLFAVKLFVQPTLLEGLPSSGSGSLTPSFAWRYGGEQTGIMCVCVGCIFVHAAMYLCDLSWSGSWDQEQGIVVPLLNRTLLDNIGPTIEMVHA